MSTSNGSLVLASHGGGVTVSIQDSAATQEGSCIVESCAKGSAAGRSPLGSGGCAAESPCEDWPITAAGKTPITRDGCLVVNRRTLYRCRRLYRRLGLQFRFIGR